MVLRTALASVPARRPPSAATSSTALRAWRTCRAAVGSRAFLATEVAGAGRLWTEDPDEMRARDEPAPRCHGRGCRAQGGRVVTSMNEGDRTIAVFREASSAALAALELHDRVAERRFLRASTFGCALRSRWARPRSSMASISAQLSTSSSGSARPLHQDRLSLPRRLPSSSSALVGRAREHRSARECHYPRLARERVGVRDHAAGRRTHGECPVTAG